MRRNAPLLFLLGVVPIVSVLSARAQATDQLQRGADNVSSTYVPGIDVLPLPKMPFSGMDRIVWTRPLEGGGTITTYLEAKVFRDTQGRLYRERHQFSVADADSATTLIDFTILDPLLHTRTTCIRANHLCHITGYRPVLSSPTPLVGPFDQGRRYLSRENLGTQSIQGLDVVGTRETISIQPGTMGNDQLITMSREFWYSPDLQTNLSVIRKDPRTGTEAIQLANLSRGEPDPSVFKVLAGYAIEDDRGVPRPSN
jgi:hypothetical protein